MIWDLKNEHRVAAVKDEKKIEIKAKKPEKQLTDSDDDICNDDTL